MPDKWAEQRTIDGGVADPARRAVLGGAAATAAMACGLCAGYGAFGAIAGRFLYPAEGARKAWMFLKPAAELKKGDSFIYRSPRGETISITRLADSGDAADFLALSSVCPHLGCQVHWESHNNRFFCPCHNGVFDPSGKATEGPPAKAGQSLARFALKIENGLLFIETAAKED